MGNSTRGEGGGRNTRMLTIPGKGLCWFKQQYVWDAYGVRSACVYLGPMWGQPVQYISVPEYLLDRRGHNTNVLHAKWLNPSIDYDVVIKGIQADQVIIGNAPMYNYNGESAVGRWVEQEDETTVTFGWKMSLPKSRTSAGKCSVMSSMTTWRKDPNRPGVLRQIIKTESGETTVNFGEGTRDPEEIKRRVLIAYDSTVDLTGTSNAQNMGCAELVDIEVKSTLGSPAWAFRLNEIAYETKGSPPPPSLLPGLAEAYKAAVEQFPKQADNNIANFIEIGQAVFGALHGDLDSIPTTLSGLWMWYRYAYSTSRSDVQQAMSYYERLKAGVELGRKYHGKVTVDTASVDNVEVRWSGYIALDMDDMAQLMAHRLWSAGLEPSLYVGWDLVPFSFVVDWFLDVGDKLEDAQAEEHYYADYNISDSCYSVHYQQRQPLEFGGNTVDCYHRFYHPPVRTAQECFYSSNTNASMTTWLKRGLDVEAMAAPANKAIKAAIRVIK